MVNTCNFGVGSWAEMGRSLDLLQTYLLSELQATERPYPKFKLFGPLRSDIKVLLASPICTHVLTQMWAPAHTQECAHTFKHTQA